MVGNMSKTYPDRIVEKTEILTVEFDDGTRQVVVSELPDDIQEEIKMMDYIRQKYANLRYEVQMTESAWTRNRDKVNKMVVSHINDGYSHPKK